MFDRSQTSLRNRPLLIAILVTATLALVIGPLSTTPASAHSYLNSSNPADGAQLGAPPQRVILKFSDEVRPTGLGVTAKGPQSATPLDAVAKDRQVVAVWPPGTASGQYQVNYRVVSVDGHVMSGGINFTIESGADPTGSGSSGAADGGAGTTPRDAATGTPSGEGASAETDDSSQLAEADAATSGQQGPGAVPVWLIAVAALIAVVGVAAFVVLRRREN